VRAPKKKQKREIGRYARLGGVGGKKFKSRTPRPGGVGLGGISSNPKNKLDQG
jgi:hypothetical protein